MVSLTEENYLKALLLLANAKGEVSINELSKHLRIKMPTANSMMKKLADKNLVHYESYKPLRLSDSGKKAAALIIRKHRLTEMYLVHKMGFGWDEVHDIAEQVEHIHSAAFFEKMDTLLGHPKFDPHGSPIPDKDGRMEWKSYHKLSECKVGDSVVLAAVTHSSDEFLRYLNTKSLSLGARLRILAIEPFDGSTTIGISRSKQCILSALACEKLLVSE